MSWKGSIYRSFLMIYRLLPGKCLLAYAIRFLRLPVDRFYCDLRFRGTFRVRINGQSVKLVHYYHTTIENEIFWKGLDGGWEKETIKLWKRCCADAETIFDVGANTGIYSLIAAAVNHEAEIYAFEPSVRVFEKLARNCRMNHFDRIICINKALSDHNGSAVFYDVDTDHQYSASLNPEMLGAVEGRKESPVSVMTIDAFAADAGLAHLDLIKIDVEMHEPQVMCGFDSCIRKFRPLIFIEVLSDEIGAKIERRLDGLGYLFFAIDETEGAAPRDHIVKERDLNYILCPEEKSARLAGQ